MNLKFPPQEAWKHLTRLNEKPGAFNRFFGKEDHRLVELKALDRFEERGLIKYIAYLLFDRDFDIARTAGRIIEKLLEGISTNELCDLDQAIREQPEYEFSSLRRIKPEDIEKLYRFGDPTPFLGICTFFPSGYVREKAIRRLSHFKTGEEFKYLFLRLNDWVSRIRIIAKTEIILRINPNQIGTFIDNFDLIERVHSWGRDDHSDVLKALEETIAHPDSRKQLELVLRHNNYRIRRLSVKIAAQKNAIPTKELFSKVSMDRDPMVRLQFLIFAKPHLDKTQLTEIISTLAIDGFMKIRKEALSSAIGSKLNIRYELLVKALCDPHISMRELSRWHLKSEEGQTKEDFQTIYRERMRQTPLAIGAILGLGEVGNSDDITLISPFLEHKKARLRRAAFRAIAQLGPDTLFNLAIYKLKHDTPSVVKEIRNFLIEHFHDYNFSNLWNVFENTDRIFVKVCVLSLTKRMSKWQRLIYLLRAGNENAQEIRSIVEHEIGKWIFSFNRSLIQPSDDEIAHVRKLMLSSSLDSELLGQLNSYM